MRYSSGLETEYGSKTNTEKWILYRNDGRIWGRRKKVLGYFVHASTDAKERQK